MSQTKANGSIFELDGIPKLNEAFPLALQHVVAMIVGCVTPAIIIAGAVNLPEADRVILIQASLVISALSTILQLFPIGGKKFHLGARLPAIVGVSFAYLPSMLAIAQGFDIATILGAQVVGGIVAIVIGLFMNQIRKFFPPLIAGTVVFTIGLSLYPTAINYMAGGTSNPTYGSWQNWLVALFTLTVVVICNHFGKGYIKLASLLIGMIAGYIFSSFFGMVNFSAVADASLFQLPRFMHFGMKFEISACVALSILFVINSIQAIGDLSATTVGSMDRQPTNAELRGAVTGIGFSNMIGALFGCLPTAAYGQNVGIITTTKVINRAVLGLAALLILAAGLLPKFSALLTTIPQAVLGGATITVFASIAMTGMRLVYTEEMNYRNTSIVGLAAALGMGISQAPGALATFPDWVITIFAKSPAVIATIVAIFLNIVLPREAKKKV